MLKGVVVCVVGLGFGLGESLVPAFGGKIQAFSQHGGDGNRRSTVLVWGRVFVCEIRSARVGFYFVSGKRRGSPRP